MKDNIEDSYYDMIYNPVSNKVLIEFNVRFGIGNKEDIKNMYNYIFDKVKYIEDDSIALLKKYNTGE